MLNVLVGVDCSSTLGSLPDPLGGEGVCRGVDSIEEEVGDDDDVASSAEDVPASSGNVGVASCREISEHDFKGDGSMNIPGIHDTIVSRTRVVKSFPISTHRLPRVRGSELLGLTVSKLNRRCFVKRGGIIGSGAGLFNENMKQRRCRL